MSRRASWIAIEPTPPAPPTIRMARGRALTGRLISSRSNRVSHAVSGRERQGGRLREAEGLRLARRPGRSSTRWNSALVPGRAMAPRVEHLVARLEQGHVLACPSDDAGGIKAQHLPATGAPLEPACAPWCRPGSGHRLDLDEQVARPRLGAGQVDIDEGGILVDGQGLLGIRRRAWLVSW